MLKRFIIAAAFVLAFAASAFSAEKFSVVKAFNNQYWPTYQVAYGATLPPVCNPSTGDVYMVNAGASAGLYRCSATNTWTLLVANAAASQTWTITADEAWALTTTTGWPAVFRHTGAAGFSVSFQNATSGSLFTDGTYLQLNAATDFLVVNQENQSLSFGANATLWWYVRPTGQLTSQGVAFAALPVQENGAIIFCSDCTKATPCAAAGPGALAVGRAGVWDCNP